MLDHLPGGVDSVQLDKEGGRFRYVIANDAATLVWLANQACITPHLFLSRRARPQRADRLILDLGPE